MCNLGAREWCIQNLWHVAHSGNSGRGDKKLAEVPWRGLDFILRTMESFWRDFNLGVNVLEILFRISFWLLYGKWPGMSLRSCYRGCENKEQGLWLHWEWGGRQIRKVFIGRIHKIWWSRRWGRGRHLPNFLTGPEPEESKWCGLQSCSLYYLCLGYCLDHFMFVFIIEI